MNEKRKKPQYTREFRQDAIKLVTEHGCRCQEAGRRLGINPSNISRWVRQYRQDQHDISEGGAARRELEEKIRRLENPSQTVAQSVVPFGLVKMGLFLLAPGTISQRSPERR